MFVAEVRRYSSAYYRLSSILLRSLLQTREFQDYITGHFETSFAAGFLLFGGRRITNI